MLELEKARRTLSVDPIPPLADDYDGMAEPPPECGHTRVGLRELTEWFVREGWRTSKQEIVERLLKDYDVVRKA